MRRRIPTTGRSPLKPSPRSIRTVALLSLGCCKNLIDSEKMFGTLAEAGFIPIADPADADAVVINTCGFLEAAKDESLEAIHQVAALRKSGRVRRLVVAGCLVQRHRARLLDWCPQIDALIGVFDRDRITDAVAGNGPQQNDIATDLPVYSSIAANATIAQRRAGVDPAPAGYTESDRARLRLTPRHYAYLRISEGCNQRCAFCTIPSIRGKMRSKPVDAVLAEAHELFTDGAFELNLIGQDTTSYGSDIGESAGLRGLLQQLDQLADKHGGAWLRLMYAYPTSFTDDLIDALADMPNLLRYVDLPLQHISDRILASMRRQTTRARTERLIERLRDRLDGIAIRTTFITGFPGETDEDHQQLLRFIEGGHFEHVGVFTYSTEPGTPAAKLTAAVDPDVAEQRYEQLMLAQQAQVLTRNADRVEDGFEVDVMIEQPIDDDDDPPQNATPSYVGRSTLQAPEVDSVTFVHSSQTLSPGQVIRCRIVDADGYDLVAQPVSELHR
jgi:ribosomal protein S12 methylthiotransferase